MSSDLHLPELAPDANKYSRGKLIVVAGSARYPGAAVLAARAGQRMGAGYTEVVTAKSVVPLVLAASPSLVVRPLSKWDVGEIPVAREGRPCAVCVGPGFVAGSKKSDGLVLDVLEAAECPVLVDGGALASLTSRRALAALADRADSGRSTLITPHAGEAARLAKSLMVRADESDQLAAVLALSLRAVVALKGPDTFVSDGKRTEVMTEGTPALAKAGTGDVLAGMIASLLAQGSEAFSAALTGVVLHALAGIASAEVLTETSVCPEDVIDAIPQAVKALQ